MRSHKLTVLRLFTLLCIWGITLADETTEEDETLTSTTPSTTTSTNTLKLAFVIFRNGVRKPTFDYPNYSHYHRHYFVWPGTLSPKGSLQMYNLGKKLHDKYSMYLPTNGLYTKSNIIMTTSSTDLSMMSAQSFLASFMIPSKDINLLPIDWQPVPLRVIPLQQDSLFLGTRHCPRYEELLFNLLTNPPEDYKKLFNDIMPYEEFQDYFALHTGIVNATCVDLIKFYDNIELREINNLTVSDWIEPISRKKMENIIDRCYQMLTENSEMKRIRVNSFMTEMFLFMLTKNHPSGMNYKFFFYSSHYTTLLALIRALDIQEQTTKRPDFGSAIIFELHRNNTANSKLEVKLFFYENSDSGEPIEIKLPFCSEPCKFKELLVKFAHNKFFEKYGSLCKFNSAGEIMKRIAKF